MSTRTNHRRKARMLAAAVRRAERRNEVADATWARIQCEIASPQR